MARSFAGPHWGRCVHAGFGGLNHSSYGYGSIPINTIFSGMNIHLPAILMFTRGTRFWPIPIYCKYGTMWFWKCVPSFHPPVNREFFLLKSLYFGGVYFQTQPNIIKYICWLIFFYSTKYPQSIPIKYPWYPGYQVAIPMAGPSRWIPCTSWAQLKRPRSLWPWDGENDNDELLNWDVKVPKSETKLVPAGLWRVGFAGRHLSNLTLRSE